MAFEASIENSSGSQVIVLKDTGSGTEAEIYSFGAFLNAFRVNKNGVQVNIIEGFGSVADARANITDGFRSAKLSPFVCRMRRGEYHWENTTYHISGYHLGAHAIHGLLFNSDYTVKACDSETDSVSVTLEHRYEGTDAGYPFPYHVSITWKLESGNRLTVTTSVLNAGKQAIPYADGWHPYFSLGTPVDDCTLQFSSHTQLEYDEELLPTGNTFSDDRFRNGALLKGIELDNSFELEGEKPFCRLSNDSLTLTIEPDKSYPILQIYIPPHRRSIAIENLTGAPDNFNNRIHLLVLQPGERKEFSTAYTIS